MVSRYLLCGLVLLIATATPTAGVCQDKAASADKDKAAPAQIEEAAPAAATRIQIYDVPGNVLFLKSEVSTTEHIQDFLDDFLKSPFPVRGFATSYPDAIDGGKPVVYYGFGGGAKEAVQLPFKDRESVLALAAGEDIDTDRPFLLKDKFGTDFPILSSKKTCRGQINDNFLIVVPKGKTVAKKAGGIPKGEAKKDAEKKDGDSTFEMFKDAKLLNDSLDPRMNDFVHRTGFGVLVAPGEEVELFRVFSDPFNRNKLKLNEKETELLEKIESAAKDANRGALGLIYSERQLNAELHVSFSNDDSFDGIFDFKAAQKQEFKPTVGLPSDNLLASLSLQTSVFASPDVTRLLLKSSVPGFGVWAGINQNAAVFQLTGNLLADSWEDVAGARVGLYAQDKGTLSVVSIFDAKNPDDFFSEVEKLMLLVEPEEVEQQSDLAVKEYQRLISELGSKKYSIRERAETRLAISGRRAVKALQKAIAETESAEIRMRATRLVARVGKQATSPVRKASNLNFWANLDPEFVIEKGQREIFGMPARMVRARLPESLSDEQTRNARRRLIQLFGDQWDQIPIVQVGDQFVAMFGYDESMLKSTVENLKEQKDPLGQLAVGDAPYFKEGSFQVHVSFQRLLKTFVDDEGDSFIAGWARENPFKDVLTSVSISLTPNYWQTSFNMPVEEARPSIVCGDLLFGN